MLSGSLPTPDPDHWKLPRSPPESKQVQNLRVANCSCLGSPEGSAASGLLRTHQVQLSGLGQTTFKRQKYKPSENIKKRLVQSF